MNCLNCGTPIPDDRKTCSRRCTGLLNAPVFMNGKREISKEDLKVLAKTKTYQEIAEITGVSRQRIYQLVGKRLKYRFQFRTQGGKGYKIRHIQSAMFWEKVNISGASDCWEWEGGSAGKGYGHLRINGVTKYAHVYAYEPVKGPLPENLWVLHTCDNPGCCNPNHLYAGTPKQNSQDREARGRGRGEKKYKPKIQELAKQGLSSRMIQEQLGVSRCYVNYVKQHMKADLAQGV